MRLLRPWGHLRLALLGLAVMAGVGTAAAWVETGPQVQALLPWATSTALLGLVAIGWLLLHRTDRQLAAANSEISDYAERLATYASLHGRFVGNIAHEIKTPLALVLNQTTLLLTDSNNPVAVRGHALSIGEDMRHLADLVDSFLRLARPFAQHDMSEHVPVPIHDVVVEALGRIRSASNSAGVRLVTTLAEPDDDEMLEVVGDFILLESMVENLVRNAIRFSPRGGDVEVVVDTKDESIVLLVRDRGTGIAEKCTTSVFDWFFDLPNDRRLPSGTGFGLAIAKRVAEHHGGTIALRNRVRGGCEFKVTLPRFRPEDPKLLGSQGPAMLPASC